MEKVSDGPDRVRVGCETLVDAVREAERVADADAERLPEEVKDCVSDVDNVSVAVVETVDESDIVIDTVAVPEAVADPDRVSEADRVFDSERDAESEGVPVKVLVVDGDALVVADGDKDRVALTLGVLEGVGVDVPDVVGEIVAVRLKDGDAVAEDVADEEGVGVTDVDAVGVKDPVGDADVVLDAVAEVL